MSEVQIALKRQSNGAMHLTVAAEGSRPWTAAVKGERISDVLTVVAAALKESGWNR